MKKSLRIAMLCWGLPSAWSPAIADGETIVVFAAQSMADAIAEIAEQYAEETGVEVQISLGASSTMARQIEAFAPANLFISANRQWAEYLLDRNALSVETLVEVAGNELVLIVPAHRTDIVLSEGLASLPATLGSERLALGDPAHVPAGLYAEAALRELGVWDQLSDQLAPAANVRSALRFVEEGAAQFGIVYRTDAIAAKNTRIAAEFPEESHQPISYVAAVVVENDTASARAFLAFLQSDTAADVFGRFGFLPPPEAAS